MSLRGKKFKMEKAIFMPISRGTPVSDFVYLCLVSILNLVADTTMSPHTFFYPSQLLNSIKTTQKLVLINFILRKLGFS